MFVPLRKAVARLGMCPTTLRKYSDEGAIPTIRNEAGQRLFDVEAYVRKTQGIKDTICYCRVSSRKQRDDLDRQVEFMRTRYPEAEIVKDIGSGLNFKRKGLRTILERLLRGDQLRLVVAHRDRLARFGFELIEFLVERNAGELVVLDRKMDSPQAELVKDLLQVLHVFSCRMHGLRRYRKEISEDKSLSEA